jgi:hypothetical protein
MIKIGLVGAGVVGVGALVAMLSGQPEDRIRPDPKLTPGAVVDVPFDEMCKPGYAARVRHFDRFVRNEAFRLYGLSNVDRRDYELDHLIPISLGGDPSDIKNIWPESRLTDPWNAEVKDMLEDVLHREVCAGKVGLAVAQWAIRTDWVEAYQLYVGSEPERLVFVNDRVIAVESVFK